MSVLSNADEIALDELGVEPVLVLSITSFTGLNGLPSCNELVFIFGHSVLLTERGGGL